MRKKVIYFLLVFLLWGCQSSNEKGKESVKSVCSFNNLGFKMDYTIESESLENDVSKLELKIVLPYNYIGIDSGNLSDSDKKEIQDNLIAQFGLSDDKINIQFNENLEVIISAESSSVREYITDSADESISLENSIKIFEKNGATCE